MSFDSLLLLMFVLGLSVGSFLNVLIYRLPRDLSVLGRSFCPHCQKKIFWYDNIPLISFIVLKGRCRHCQSPIGWQYPIVELITGFLFVLTVFVLQSQGIMYQVLSIKDLATMFYYLFIISSLIVIFFADLKYEIIPDKIVYSASIVSFLYIILTTKYLIPNYFLSALGASVFFYAIYFLTRGRGLGFGDVKLAFLMGLFLGWPKILVAIYSALLTGAAVSVLLIILGKKTMKSTIPFGPFLAGNTILTFFYGNKLSIYIQKMLGF